MGESGGATATKPHPINPAKSLGRCGTDSLTPLCVTSELVVNAARTAPCVRKGFAMAENYLFLATQSAASLPIAYQTVKSTLGTALALNVAQDGQYWTNGFVLRLWSRDPTHMFKPYLTDRLKRGIEFWLLHDNQGHAIDNMSDGPGTMALKKMGSKSICQLFLRYDKNDVRMQTRFDRFRDRLEAGGVACRYAFDFSNGTIYFLTSTQPSNVIYRRCEADLRPPMEFTFITPLGICLSPHVIGEIDDEKAFTTLKPPRIGEQFAS